MLNDRKFFFYVDKTLTCWLWTGSKDKRWGYGFVNRNGQTRGAHRWSWELVNGPIPKGMIIMHKCDNPGCVNPDHLALGTHQDNVDDMIRKGRAKHYNNRFGVNHPQAKLNEDAVRDIRSSKLSLSKMGAKYGVCIQTISRVRLNMIWKHVK